VLHGDPAGGEALPSLHIRSLKKTSSGESVRDRLGLGPNRFQRIRCLTGLGGSGRRGAVREVTAWLNGLCDSSVFFYFPFSYEGWAENIHPMVVEQPTELIK
jgi:hypothetical protein